MPGLDGFKSLLELRSSRWPGEGKCVLDNEDIDRVAQALQFFDQTSIVDESPRGGV